MKNNSAPWVLGTAMLSLLVLVGAWFLAISPRLDEAAFKEEMLVAENARIDQLRIELAALKRDAENIEEFREELVTLRSQIPAEARQSELARRIERLAQEAGVFVASVVAENPAPVMAQDSAAAPEPAPVAEEAPEAEGEPAEDGSAEAEPAPAPVAAGSTAMEGLFALPLEVVVVGGYDATVAFIESLQDLDDQILVVSKAQLTAQPDNPATETRPATAAGDVETRLTLQSFVLVDHTQQPEAEETEAPALPRPGPGQRNPYVPLG